MTPPVAIPADLPRLAPRQADGHKGDYGRVLLVGGSQGMAGAIGLSARAALRSGAGLVKVATASTAQATVAGFEPCAMTVSLPADGHGRIAAWALPLLAELVGEATVVACGPGLGRSDELVQVVQWLYQSVTQPMVVDADALFALAHLGDAIRSPGGPRILTPHPGEFARLIGHERISIEEREPLARQLADQTGTVVVLKGHGTVVTDGKHIAINPTGNPGMATGGTGDVLTGIIAAIVAQQLAPFDAARLGVYLHGLSGDLAAESLGQVSLIASDLVDHLPQAFRRIEKRD